MKRIFTILGISILTIQLIAQAPQAFTYQAVVRYNTGEIVAEELVRFRISIHDASTTGTVIYQESHPPVFTNQFGLANLKIGLGSPSIGSFALIDWSSSSKYLEVELDPTGGTNYNSLGTTQLFSVPYALYAERATLSNDNNWIITGSNMYADIPGNVGIGTPNPDNARLEIVGDMIPGIEVSSFMSNGMTAFSSAGGGFAAGHFHGAGAGTYGIWTESSEYEALYASSYSPSYAAIRASGVNAGIFDGKVGIGTSDPLAQLHISSLSSSWGMLKLENSNSGQNEVSIAFREGYDVTGSNTWVAGVGLYGKHGCFVIGRDGPRFLVDNNGNIGIGTHNPTFKLDVDLGDVLIQGPQSFDASGEQATLYLGTVHHYIRSEFGYGLKIGTYGTTDALNIAENSGNVGIGTITPGQKLTVRGNVRVESEITGLPVVELGEGLDYAEGFDISESIQIPPGSVMIIDPNNPGQLTLSKYPYDSKVAGIVAGANNLGSGVKLGTGQFDCDVALAGRVYCNVDATYGAISPGDLLTTSPTSGHAMIVKDNSKAQGAILGKAMESLDKGQKGQILVLVTLQ